MQAQAVMTGKPREDSSSLDVDEQEVNGTDAFKQLVALSRKQSVNRPQTVCRAPHACVICTGGSSQTINAHCLQTIPIRLH